jgi:hypothetical protein
VEILNLGNLLQSKDRGKGIGVLLDLIPLISKYLNGNRKFTEGAIGR